jgi:hypothetical protein
MGMEESDYEECMFCSKIYDKTNGKHICRRSEELNNFKIGDKVLMDRKYKEVFTIKDIKIIELGKRVCLTEYGWVDILDIYRVPEKYYENIYSVIKEYLNIDENDLYEIIHNEEKQNGR